jgi:hypothetical protein
VIHSKCPSPDSIRRVIGGPVKSVRIEYTAYGVQTLVVLHDGNVLPLEEYQSADKAAKARRVLDEDVARMNARIAERSLKAPRCPAVKDRKEFDAWMASIVPDVRKLLTMTNRDFRAQQGPNDESAKAGQKTQVAGPGQEARR